MTVTPGPSRRSPDPGAELPVSPPMSPRRPPPVLFGAVAGVVVAVVFSLLTVSDAPPPGPVPTAFAAPEPAPPAALASPTGFYVDPSAPAARQAQEWAAAGRADDARRIGTIAAQPMPDWLTQPTGAVGAEVARVVDRAAAVGQKPLLVAYHVPGRDCGSYSGGGAKDAGDYRAWIREVAGALAGRAATVVLEPDAVAHEVTGCGAIDGRPELLADAVQVLKAAGPVAVYLDAGNPGFVPDTGALAEALRRSGVAAADGLSLNVANFYTTDEVLAYGHALSAALGGAHFVVDTSRNGNGRIDRQSIDGGPSFCNPPARALGQAPTTSTGDPLVDAYLWIKRVGESDGACRPGEPPAGQWWPEYALGLVPAGG
jgi:endoglucanase